MTLACCQVVNHLISWLDGTLQFSKCEVEEENLKLENQDVFIHLQILSIRIDLYYLEVHKKKNTKITDTVAFYIGFVDCHLKNPGNSTHSFRRSFLTLLSVSGSGTTGLPGAMNAWFFIVDEFSPKCHGSQENLKKKMPQENRFCFISFALFMVIPPNLPAKVPQIFPKNP